MYVLLNIRTIRGGICGIRTVILFDRYTMRVDVKKKERKEK